MSDWDAFELAELRESWEGSLDQSCTVTRTPLASDGAGRAADV